MLYLRVFFFCIFVVPVFGNSTDKEASVTHSAAAHVCADALTPSDDASLHPYAVWIQKFYEVKSSIESRLGSDRDPFLAAGAFSYEQANQLMDSLSFQPVPGQRDKKVISILGEVRNFLNRSAFAVFDHAELSYIVDELLSFSLNWIQAPEANKAMLYRALLSLELMTPHLYALVPQVSVDRDGEPVDKEQEQEEKNESNTPPQPPRQESQKPRIPKFDGDYDPHTKDSENLNGAGEEKAILATVNGEFHYWKFNNFNSVARKGGNRFRRVPVPMLDINIGRDYGAPTVVDMFIHEMDRGTWVPLGLPEGVSPQASASGQYQLRRSENGNYEILTNQEHVHIPVVQEIFNMNPAQREVLTKTVGVMKEEWPERMKKELFPLLVGRSTLEAARLVESFIRNRYLYSVDKKDELDPIEVLERGAFQCDMAALIMVALLRDHLQIPSRAVGGYRSVAGKTQSKLMLPSEAHAWVEVWHDGRWHTFDPTPRIKDRKTQEEGEGESGEQKDFDDEIFENEFEPPRQDRDAPPTEDVSASEKEVKEGEEDNESRELSETEAEKIREDLEKALEIGSQSLLIEKSQNPLLDAAIRRQLADILAPQFETGKSLQRLLSLKTDVRHKKQYRPWLKTAEDALVYRQAPLAESLLELSMDLRRKGLNETFQRLLQVEDRLRAFVEFHGSTKENQELTEVLSIVARIQKEFYKFAAPNHHEIAVVKKFIKDLPPHSRRVFLDRFGIDDIDTSPNTTKAFRALLVGDVQDLNLIRALFPLTEFIKDATPAPSYFNIRTMNEDSRSRAPKMYLPATDLNDLSQAIKGDPQKSFVKNLMEGTLFRSIHPRIQRVPIAGGITDPRRVTIALFDTSGSMNGDPGDFQAALLAAFTDRALSDRTPEGVYRHLVQLMGFDDSVHKIIKVINSEDAFDVIKNHRKAMANTNKGTKLMVALEQAFAAILDAQSRAREPLASANIVLMTDGQADIDIKKIREWRAAINRKTQVKVMFVSINQTNEELIKLTEDMKAAGVQDSYYREYDAEAIGSFMTEAKKVPTVDMKRDFDSKASPSSLPSWIEQELDRASLLMRKGVARYEAHRPRIDLEQEYRRLGQTRARSRPDGAARSAFEEYMDGYKSFIKSSRSYNDDRTSEVVSGYVFSNLEQILGRTASQLNLNEIEETRSALFLFGEKQGKRFR